MTAGKVKFAEDVVLGLELDSRLEGAHDGSTDGERYFDCKPGYGYFTRNSSVVQLLDPKVIGYPNSILKKLEIFFTIYPKYLYI